MSRLRCFLILAVAAVLVLIMVLTWGSIGSLVMLMCLMLMGSALLYQHFLNNREPDDFQKE